MRGHPGADGGELHVCLWNSRGCRVGFLGLLVVELICEQCSSVKNLGLEDVESIIFLVFLGGGREDMHNLCQNAQCFPKVCNFRPIEKCFGLFLLSLLPDGEGPEEGYRDA